MDPSDLKKPIDGRVREADVLLSNKLYGGACHLLGYAVESALKAGICRQFRRHAFPDKQLTNPWRTPKTGH